MASSAGYFLERNDVMQGYKVLQDFGQNAYWYPEDGYFIDEEIWDIKMDAIDKETGAVMSPNSWFDKLERCYNDHRNVKFNRSGKPFSPTHVSKRKQDMVTNDGVFRINQLTTGDLIGKYFNTYASGTGTARELPNDDSLVAESYRVSLITDGFGRAAGDSQVYLGRFPPQAPTATIYETGVFDQQVGGTMLFRTVFDDESKIEHKELEGTYTLSQTIRLVALPTIR